jgi:hypothetical protein
MRKRAWFVGLFAVLVGSQALVPAVATDDPVQTLSAYGLNSSLVYVGIDDAGNATAAWSEAGALMVVRRREGGKFVEPQPLAAGHVSEASLDVAPNGKAVIAFSGGMAGGELMVAVRPDANSDFGSPQILVIEEDPSFVSDAEAKISASGRAVVVWTSDTTGQPTRIMSSLSDTTGRFTAPEAIAAGTNLQNPQVDVDASGRALAVWDHTEASAPNEIVMATAGTTGGFGDPQVLETLEQGPGAPDVAVNASGDAVVAYADFTSEGEGVSRDKVEARYGSVDGTFGGFQNLTDPSTPTAASEVEVAIDDGGRAAVMASLTVQSEYGVYAGVSDPSGTFAAGSMQNVSPHDRVGGPGVPRSSYEIAAGGGDFTAFWINDHDEDGTRNEVWTATSQGGVFGAAHQLSPEDDDSPDRAHGARNADGDVVAGWLLFVDENGAQVTPVAPGPDPIFGDDGDDTLTGTSAGEAIYAAKGDDTVNAGGGGDDVFGEQGNDRLSGAGGGDALSGGPGRDTLVGGPGTDSFDGGGGRDTCVLSSKSERSRTQSCERIRVP